MYPSFLGNYLNDNTYYSKIPQENYHPSPIYFPLEDEAVFCEFFQQQHFFSNDHSQNNTNILTHDMNINMGECGNNNEQEVDVNFHLEPENSSPRKRPSKRDRHSKINTARGPRDRRMRLSLDVAKKLFGLQDLLGFDKASKTVDWLLTKSKTAILELLHDHNGSFMGLSNSASSTSECEVLSGTGAGEQPMVIEISDDQETTKKKVKSCSEISKKPKEKITRGVRRCVDFHHPLAKASRERARERARERTTEKRNKNHGGVQDPRFRPCLDQAMDQNINQLVSWCPFEETRRQNISQVDQMTSNFHIKQGFVDDNSSRFMMGNWNSSNMFNYQHTSGLTHEHQFNEFQITGKAWEGRNN